MLIWRHICYQKQLQNTNEIGKSIKYYRTISNININKCQKHDLYKKAAATSKCLSWSITLPIFGWVGITRASRGMAFHSFTQRFYISFIYFVRSYLKEWRDNFEWLRRKDWQVPTAPTRMQLIWTFPSNRR